MSMQMPGQQMCTNPGNSQGKSGQVPKDQMSKGQQQLGKQMQENMQKMYSQYHVNIYSGNGRKYSSGNSTARNIRQHRLQGRLCYQQLTYLICIDRLIRVAVYKPAEQTTFFLYVMPAGCGGWYTRPWHHRRRLVTTTSNTLLSRESPATSRRRCEGKPYSIKHGVSCEGIVDGSLGVFITRPITSL